MRLEPLLRADLTMVLERGEDVADRDALLKRLAQRVAAVSPGIEAGKLQGALLSRERQGATSTPEGVAFPHAMLDDADRTLVVVARVNGGVSFGRQGHPPSDLIFALVGPRDSAWQHVSILARLARICRRPGALAYLRGAKSEEQLLEYLKAEDARNG